MLELRAVIRVAHRARGHGDGATGIVLVGDLAVLGELVVDALHGGIREPAAGVDAVAKPRDLAAAHQGLHFTVLGHIGHEQPRGVRAQIHHRDASLLVHGRGSYREILHELPRRPGDFDGARLALVHC